jgi:vacuolar-type H+-ATPase subunit H
MSINEQTANGMYSGNGVSPSAPSGADEGQDSSQAAARLLEMTARETDRWRAEAKDEAAATVASARDEAATTLAGARDEAGATVAAARQEAAELVRAAREEADRLVTAAREQAEQTVNDARVEAYRVREQTTAVREQHDEDVARLQQLASEHREKMRHHLTAMLDQVEATDRDASQ